MTFSASPYECVFCGTPAKLRWVLAWLRRRGQPCEVQEYDGGAALVAVRSEARADETVRKLSRKISSEKIGRRGCRRTDEKV